MLEILILVTALGFVLSMHHRMGLANPFQIYFLIWFLVFFGYLSLEEKLIKVSIEFLSLLLAAKLIVFLFLLIIVLRPTTKIKLKKLDFNLFSMQPSRRFLVFAQIIVIVALPFVYMHALNMAGGSDIFTSIGYSNLRLSMTDEGGGGSFGIWGYFSVLAMVVASLHVQLYIEKKIIFARFLISIITGLFYVYIGTGRTFILLFSTLIFYQLVATKVIKVKGVLVLVFLVFIAFLFVAAMTGKGVSWEASFTENVVTFFENLNSYTVAPVLALFRLINLEGEIDWGLNSFRFIFSLFYALGLSDSLPVGLVKTYQFVPMPTNVYTVYEVYFRDFSYFGLIIPSVFMLFHWWLYLKAKNIGGIWIYYYSASLYPLIMQFFQDQYFNLLSTWIQIVFWYWLLINTNKYK